MSSFFFLHNKRRIFLDIKIIIRAMMQIKVPDELPTILRNFTLSVLRTNPRDIIDHAVDYFTQLQQQKAHLITDDMHVTPIPFSFSSSIKNHQQKLKTSTHYVALSGELLFNQNVIFCF